MAIPKEKREGSDSGSDSDSESDDDDDDEEEEKERVEDKDHDSGEEEEMEQGERTGAVGLRDELRLPQSHRARPNAIQLTAQVRFCCPESSSQVSLCCAHWSMASPQRDAEADARTEHGDMDANRVD